jgi:hypothetical protein
MVVAEFPIHCSLELLYYRGFGGISIQSLLVFDGVQLAKETRDLECAELLLSSDVITNGN